MSLSKSNICVETKTSSPVTSKSEVDNNSSKKKNTTVLPGVNTGAKESHGVGVPQFSGIAAEGRGVEEDYLMKMSGKG